MIAIAQHHVFEVALMPLGPIEVIVKLRLLNLPNVERLIHDDEAHLVCKIEKLRRGRIVRGAQSVHAHRFQDLQLPLDRARVDRSTKRTQIVMITDTANLHRLAIKEESLFNVETKRANAEWRLVSINHSAVLR